MLKEKSIDELAAENEEPVSPSLILAEIVPLMQDYFVGEVTFYGDCIVYRMPNGQTFRICAENFASHLSSPE